MVVDRGPPPMIRVLVDRLDDGARTAALLDAEEHHLRVRRVTDGETIEALDGKGRRAHGRIRINGKQFSIELEAVRSTPPPVPIRLLVAAGDRERFLWLIEKATELGATDIVPITTERTASVNTRIRDEHRGKLERRALEALKQCGGAWSPAIAPVAPLDLALARTDTPIRWLADHAGGRPDSVPAERAATVIIGPEGGLTDRERSACVDAGFTAVRLGPRTLRFETATLAALALIAAGREETDA